jgi:hypothetical protein
MGPAEKTPEPLSFSKRVLLCSGIHALLMFPVLLLSVASGLGLIPASPALKATADFLGLLCWYPINSFIAGDTVGLFFMLIPLNSLLYGLLFALPLHTMASRSR